MYDADTVINMNLWDLWKLIVADLERARSALPGSAATHVAIQEYQSYLNANEFELACDMLETYAEENSVSVEFWLALRDAAVKMKLPAKAEQYAARANNN